MWVKVKCRWYDTGESLRATSDPTVKSKALMTAPNVPLMRRRDRITKLLN